MNPSVNASNNRLSSSDGYQFDAAGNTIRDPQNRKFTYDAENKQTKVETVDANGNATGTIGQYWFDGEGRRVKKHVPATGETTVFIYDASSRLVAEYSTIRNPTPQVAYLTNDHLGSPRINTNELGAVTSRHDYRPYGEEVTERTHTQYAADTIRKQFTGYERDGETDLDFAQARMVYSLIGRFTSVDPYNIVIEKDRTSDRFESERRFFSYLSHPELWNRYVYTINNPLKFTDASGEMIYLVGTPEERKAALARLSKLLGPERMKYVDISTVCHENLGEVTILSATSRNSNLMSNGKNDDEVYFSVKMADILESKSIVEYRFGTSYTKSDGSTESLQSQGGAATLGADESTTGNIQIWIHPTSDVTFADQSAAMPLNAGLSNDGKPLSFERDMNDAHEFGHAHEGIFGLGTRSEGSKDLSVKLENIVSARYPSPQRRKNHR